MSDQVEGTVKWFNDEKGFGFIEREDGKDVFVHYLAIKVQEGEFASLNENDKAEYETAETDKGLEARDGVVTEKAPFQQRHRDRW